MAAAIDLAVYVVSDIEAVIGWVAYSNGIPAGIPLLNMTSTY